MINKTELVEHYGDMIKQKYADDNSLYAKEICAMDSTIEWVGTGGGCDALLKRTEDGGWLVLTQDCNVPVAPTATDCVYLIKYPYNADGWGADGEEGEFLSQNMAAGAAVAMMVMTKSSEFADREYRCFWGDQYPPCKYESERVKDVFFFTQNTGFDEEDIAAIRGLELGRSYTVDKGMCGEHCTIVRAA